VNRGEGDSGSAKSDLLKWVQSKIPEYNIKGFKTDWNDGRALNGLVNALAPGSCNNHQALDPSRKVDNCRDGINLANDTFGIPKIITPESLAHPKVDEQSVMTYISYFRNAELEAGNKRDDKALKASQCRAYGPGLTECVANEPGEFVVEVPKGAGKLEIKVEGPSSTAQVNIKKTDNPDGTAKYDVSYNPTEPGDYKVHVTLDGIHIPGSVFHVHVLEAVSLGGEGKIRVFYSTTSSSDKGRSDVINLQRLLEQKQIHKRPDFEPWIAVDIMERDDREAVFKKAGTRALPIVFIDDKYTGDYDTVQDLEENGKLDPQLNFHKNKRF